MDIGDPSSWSHGANAFKSIFDGLRSAIGLLREMQSAGRGTADQQQLIGEALEKASKAAGIAEAQVAQAFGYELCRCEFPPIPMRTVGCHPDIGGRKGPVYECPECGYNTAGPWAYNRIAPERASTNSAEA